ncbi:MAG: ABC transporter ATP-binding protein [Chloroflexi bacterium]|nr:ABC transporter ATP-binding protein [Chloroflexota bacterium]
MSLLSVERLCAGYGEVQVLWDVSLALEAGQTTCLVGANGAGKTTLLRAIMGQLPARSGTVTYDGREVTTLPTHQKAGLGLVLVPEGRQLFTSLTVQENLDLGATPHQGRAAYAHNLKWVYDLFPRLAERRNQKAGTLSGGEQQMLAIGRGLMASPRVLMLDELSLGLAPVLVITLYQIIWQLKDAGITMLLVEQNVHMAMAVSDQAYVLSEGRITLSGPAAQVRDRPEVRQAYLGL